MTSQSRKDRMHRYRTVFSPATPLIAMASALFGCHGASVCNPPGATSGQIVNTESSEAYRTLIAAKGGGDAPHMACRAETVVPITVVMVDLPTKLEPTDPSDQARHGFEGPALWTTQHGDKPGPGTHIDPRLHPTSEFMRPTQGQYRVLGVGRGVDEEDCGKTALQACNDAVDAYCRQQQMNRPLGITCQLAQNQEYCRP
jgi:hypothetical protein